MSYIELFGCTGVGKSTLLDGLLQAYLRQGIDALTGEDLALEKVHLNWVKGHLARTLLIDLISFFFCLLTWQKRMPFYRVIFNIVFGLPSTIDWLEKINIIRNTLKKIGIYELIERNLSNQRIILMDEGTLQTAHYLFAHTAVEIPDANLSKFISLVPLPNIAIYLQQNDEILIERTLARGHKRIRGGSRAMTERFIKRAVTTFDKLTQDSTVASRLLIVDPDCKIRIPRSERDFHAEGLALEMLKAGLDLTNTDFLRK